MRVGADIGGTFTDVVSFDETSGEVRLAKTLSTLPDLERGVRTGISRVADNLGEAESIIHGSTIVINAVIERRGAKTALITTKGFRDVYEIGRINRPDSFNPRFRKHRPLIAEAAARGAVGEDLASLIEANKRGLDAAYAAIEFARHHGDQPGVSLPISSVQLRAPWPRRRIACVGGNFADHLAGMEENASLEELTERARAQGQWGFWKVNDEAWGTEDDVEYPPRTEHLDYEGEGAIILSKRGKNLSADQIDEYVWGVTLMNDLSIRDERSRAIGMSYNLPKNFDGSSSLGPSILVGDDLPYQSLDVEVRVNGKVRQQFNTSMMIWSFGEVLEHLSRSFTLIPGDIISGGTAMGTAADKTPRDENGQYVNDDLFLHRGDVVEVSSELVGTLRNKII